MPEDTCNERWLPIPGYEDCYQVSDAGQVRSIPRATRHHWRTLRQISIKRNGYRVVSLSREGAIRQWRVHQLVMLAFVGPCPKGQEVCHENGVSSDNRLSNLRYDTHRNNQLDVARHGHHQKANKTHCDRGHEFTPENTRVTTKNQRRCRECNRADQRSKYQRASDRTDRADAVLAFPGEFCGHGHEYTQANTYIDPAGRRACRECRRAGLRRAYYKRKAANEDGAA